MVKLAHGLAHECQHFRESDSIFRGLGFSLLSRFGARAALVATAVAFGLVHGFLVPLPLFVIVGLSLGWLRMRTGSIYPGMLMHGTFNAVATILAVSLGA